MNAIWRNFDTINLREIFNLSQPMLHIIIILAIAFFALRFTAKAIRVIKSLLLGRIHNNSEELKRIETLSRAFRYVTSVAITLITGTLILSELGISIAPILAAAGVVGVAIGFGAQSLVKDFLSGFFLLLENQIRQGAVVEVAGKGALVEEITLRYVKLSDYDGNVHFISNGTITTVSNLSREYAFAVIDLQVAFNEDAETLTKLMQQVSRDMRTDDVFSLKILEDIEIAGIDAFTDNGYIIKCRFKVPALSQWDVKREFLRRIKLNFAVNHIGVAHPRMTVYPGMRKDGNAPTFNIATSRFKPDNEKPAEVAPAADMATTADARRQ